VSTAARLSSDRQLARLLQIGVVLEEVVEARSHHHYQSLSAGDRDPEIERLLEDAADESARHRERLEELIDGLDAESIPFEQVESLVEAQYGQNSPEDFDGVLYDQLCNEETAYKFYDDLIEAVEDSDAAFSIDTEELVAVLEGIRAEEEAGVEEVTAIMERRD